MEGGSVEAQLKRLAFLVSLSALIGLGSASAYWYYKVQTTQAAVQTYYELLTKSHIDCEKDHQSFSCGLISGFQRSFDDTVAYRDQSSDKFETLLALTFALPVGALFLFLSLRWVITGRWSSTPLRGSTAQDQGETATRTIVPSRTKVAAKGALWAGGAIALTALLYVRPERTFQTLVATVTQVILLSALVWVVMKIKNRNQRRDRE
jgi:hypothetical protein